MSDRVVPTGLKTASSSRATRTTQDMAAPILSPPRDSTLPLAIVVAMTAQRVIGCGDELPWQIPEDLALFRRLTLGNTVVMGHGTYRAIGRPLEKRNNLILSRTLTQVRGAIVCSSFRQALSQASELARPVFFIGGASIYRRALPVVERLHVSWIKTAYAGDRYFPDFSLEEWQAIEQRHFPEFTYTCYQRKRR